MNAQNLGIYRFVRGIRSGLRLRHMMVLGSLMSSLAVGSERELVILTTFSREPLLPLIEEFTRQYEGVDVQIVHRRAQSSVQLLNKSYINNIDLVLSSSPYLMQQLAESGRLAILPDRFQTPDWLHPFVLPPTNKVVTIGYSGAGVTWNKDYLAAHHLPTPKTFADLANPVFFGHVTMSTPARSGTTQLMVESVLKKYGWEAGWRLLMNVGANLGTVSSRSFGVSDYIARGQFGAGPTIDSYALILERKFPHVSFAYDDAFTLMPTYVAQVSQKQNDVYAKAFIDLLMSKGVQANMDANDFSKHGVNDDSLFSDSFTRLSMATMMRREECMNLLFDLAITKRLPALKDTWLMIINAREQFKSQPEVLARLQQIERSLFSVPITESALDGVINSIYPLADEQDTELQANKAMLLAKLSHEWKKQLEVSLNRANADIKQLLRESGQ
ncbi:ABC transporter substrate-binding protein [Vibrio fluvialis]